MKFYKNIMIWTLLTCLGEIKLFNNTSDCVCDLTLIATVKNNLHLLPWRYITGYASAECNRV